MIYVTSCKYCPTSRLVGTYLVPDSSVDKGTSSEEPSRLGSHSQRRVLSYRAPQGSPSRVSGTCAMGCFSELHPLLSQGTVHCSRGRGRVASLGGSVARIFPPVFRQGGLAERGRRLHNARLESCLLIAFLLLQVALLCENRTNSYWPKYRSSALGRRCRDPAQQLRKRGVAQAKARSVVELVPLARTRLLPLARKAAITKQVMTFAGQVPNRVREAKVVCGVSAPHWMWVLAALRPLQNRSMLELSTTRRS